MFFTVVYCDIWFSIACFWIPPRLGPKQEDIETIADYLDRLNVPKCFVEDYVVPLFSSIASSPHKLFPDFPAIYLTDYKREAHMSPHDSLSETSKPRDLLCF